MRALRRYQEGDQFAAFGHFHGMSRFHQREVPGRVLTEFTNADALHPEMVALGVLHVWESFRSRAVQHRVVGSFLTLTVSARRLWARRLAHSSLQAL